MSENQSVKDRLKFYIQSQNISVRQFERDCGLCNAYVNSIRQGIQPDSLKKIVEKHPTLNIQWLLTGEGTMLRTDATSESREEAEMEETDLVRELRRQLEEERRKNEELQKKTDAQQSTINSMAKTMEMMMEEKQKSICG